VSGLKEGIDLMFRSQNGYRIVCQVINRVGKIADFSRTLPPNFMGVTPGLLRSSHAIFSCLRSNACVGGTRYAWGAGPLQTNTYLLV